VKEFAKHSLTVSFDTLTLSPFSGLVANNVILLDRDTKKEIATVSHVKLDIDLPKLVRKERFLERIELESANLSLPYDRKDPNSQRLELKDIAATIILPPDRIEIVQAKAYFHGLQIGLTGSLLRPDQDSETPPKLWQSEKIQSARPILEQVVEHLERLRFKNDGAPVLDTVISGDLAEPSSLTLKAKITVGPFNYNSYACSRLEAEALLTPESLEIANLKLTDSHGRFHLTGEFPLVPNKQASVTVDSSIDLGSLLTIVTKDLPIWSVIQLTTSPKLTLQGTLRLDQRFTWKDPPVDIIGHLNTGAFRIGEEEFQQLSGDFHLQGPRVFARNIELQHRQGRSTGKLISTPEGGIRYDFEVGMDPTLVQSLPLPEEAKEFLQRWEFRPTSGIALNLLGKRKGRDAATWDHKGKAVLTNCRFETAEIHELSMDFQLNPHAYHFSNVEIQLAPDEARAYSGGTMKAERVSVSARDRLTMLTNVEGSVDPGQVIRCFHPKTADQLDRFRFSQPPEVRIPQGTIDPNGIEQTNLQVEVKSTGTMTTEVLGKPVPFDQPRFGLTFHKENLIVRTDHAGVFGGDLSGNVDMRDLTSKRDYTAKIELRNLDFTNVAEVYFPDHQSDGQLNAVFAWRGRDLDITALDGKGEARLLGSGKLEVQLLDLLSALMKEVIGESSVSDKTDLRLAFLLKESVLDLESISANLKSFRIDGKGSIHLPTEAVNFEASLVQSESDTVRSVLYEIFGTYKCTGTLEKPEWKRVGRLTASDVLKAAEKLTDPRKKVRLDPGEKLDAKAILEGFLPKDKSNKPQTKEDR
ncbi:MAG: hypothetical protein ACI8T1_003813, partial [Verrucomicrobiales bacterium]